MTTSNKPKKKRNISNRTSIAPNITKNITLNLANNFDKKKLKLKGEISLSSRKTHCTSELNSFRNERVSTKYFWKIQSDIKEMIDQCDDFKRMPPQNFRDLNRSMIAEQMRNRNYDNTREILQNLHMLNFKDLKRNYEWQILSQTDQ